MMLRKRKLDLEVGSERRNPIRKARPPERFAVEEKSELACKTPRSVDVRRLLEVQCVCVCVYLLGIVCLFQQLWTNILSSWIKRGMKMIILYVCFPKKILFFLTEQDAKFVCGKKQVDVSSTAKAGKKGGQSSGRVGARRRSRQFDVRAVDEITDEDLENVADHSRDKIWDKENVSGPPSSHPSSPHCFSPPWPSLLPPPSGQLMPPVPAEDSGHEDHLS